MLELEIYSIFISTLPKSGCMRGDSLCGNWIQFRNPGWAESETPAIQHNKTQWHIRQDKKKCHVHWLQMLGGEQRRGGNREIKLFYKNIGVDFWRMINFPQEIVVGNYFQLISALCWKMEGLHDIMQWSPVAAGGHNTLKIWTSPWMMIDPVSS